MLQHLFIWLQLLIIFLQHIIMLVQHNIRMFVNDNIHIWFIQTSHICMWLKENIWYTLFCFPYSCEFIFYNFQRLGCLQSPTLNFRERWNNLIKMGGHTGLWLYTNSLALSWFSMLYYALWYGYLVNLSPLLDFRSKFYNGDCPTVLKGLILGGDGVEKFGFVIIL